MRLSLALLALALLLPTPSVRGEEPEDRPVPAYALPDGVSAEPALPRERRELVEFAAATLRHARTAEDAREGWRILAGIGVDALPAAVRALGQADWFGRALLVRGIGSMEDPRVLPVLHAAARDPAWAVRAAAAEGLGFHGNAATISVLRPLLADDAWRVREATVRSVRRIALRGAISAEAATALLLPHAGDGDADVRLEIFVTLADFRRPEAASVLLPALAILAAEANPPSELDRSARPDPGTRVTLRVLRGLADGHGDDAGLSALLWELTEDTRARLAGHFLREWFHLQGPAAAENPEAVQRAVRAFRDPGSTEYSRVPAERTLVEIGEPAAHALIESISEPDRARRMLAPDDSREVLELAVRILGDGAPEALGRLMADTAIGSTVRLHAADLGRRLFPAELVTVFRALYDERQDTYALQGHALRGLAAGGDPDAARLVAEALVRGDGEYPPASVRLVAAEIMARDAALRNADAVHAALARETHGESLARLLGILRDGAGDAAPETLAPFLADPRPKVREHAADALSRVPGPRTVAILRARLDAEDGATTLGDELPLPVERDPEPGEDGDAPRDDADALAEADALRRELDLRDGLAIQLRTSLVTSIRMAAGADATGVLVSLLDHPRPEVRAAAAGNLVSVPDASASAALARRIEVESLAIEGPDAALGLRDRLLHALVACGGPDADAWITARLREDEGDLREMILDTLLSARSRVHVGDAVAALVEEGPPGSSTRLLALEVLALDRDRARAPLLLRLLAEARTGEERRQILEPLGRTGDPAAVEPVSAFLPAGDPAALDSDDFATAVMAMETLGDLRTPEAAAPLEALLERVLPRALGDTESPFAALHRDVSMTAFRALGRVEGPRALRALVRAALHNGFSRAAELATRDSIEFAHAGLPPEPRLPRGLERIGRVLGNALTRTRDAELSRAIEDRLVELRRSGGAFALSEEWLSWLGDHLGSPPDPHPYRPRWQTRMVLLRQVIENAPRDSSLDRDAQRLLFTDGAEVTGDFAAAATRLAQWRRLYREQDPYGADEDARVLDAYEDLLAMAVARKAGDVAGAEARYRAAMARAEGDSRVPRLAAHMLLDLRDEGPIPEEAALAAVQGAPFWPPNHRVLGRARLALGRPGDAVEPLETALALSRRRTDPRDWREGFHATYTYMLARAYTGVGRIDEALALAESSMSNSDLFLDWIPNDPALETLRKDPRFAEAVLRARATFDELP